ncbi:MAG: exodeoxyribonuclease VII large subunit [Limisphaerales bacterium]
MPRPSQSQWNFGDLSDDPDSEPADTRKIHSVSEITGKIKALLNREIGAVWVSGEVTNFRAQSSGHCYFSLKDGRAQLSCVLFRSQRIDSRDALADGQHVLLSGDLTVYEARGQYQLIVTEVEMQGVGALQLKFEKLKQKLNNEGLFDPDRKRELPQFPACIGLITSPTGAALQDVIHVIERRNPALQIIHAPVRVQGDGSAREIARAIKRLNQFSSARETLDLILLTRGGGSLEDLWAFNEEVVARAIADSQLPIVSAVGHEIDFTIADFTADLRAATPSAGAEIITENVFASRQFVADAHVRISQLARRGISYRRDDLDNVHHRLELRHPRRRLAEDFQRFDDTREEFQNTAKSALQDRRQSLRDLNQRLNAQPLSQLIDLHRQRIEELTRRLIESARSLLQTKDAHTKDLSNRLRLLSPQSVLDRGYSITTNAATGELIKSPDQAPNDTQLKTTVRDGEIVSTVDSPKRS